MIPITGGTFTAKRSQGRGAGEADWNVTRQDGLAHVFAKYSLETDDGEFIVIENEGLLLDVANNTLPQRYAA